MRFRFPWVIWRRASADRETPVGVRGLELLAWFQKTAVFHNVHQLFDGREGVDNEFAVRSFENVGAWILGRNMFGPIRGRWEDDSWKGWWGDEPPYHVPVFVLTHHARAPLPMKGGTTFYFVTDGPESALKQANTAAEGQDVRIGGGISTIRQYLTAGQVDEMHPAFSPVLLGEGENLFRRYSLAEARLSACPNHCRRRTTHVILQRAFPGAT